MMTALSRKPDAFGIFNILEEILESPTVQALQQEKHLALHTARRGQLWVILAEDAPLAHKKAITLKEVLNHPLVIFNSGDGESWHELFLRQHGYPLKPIRTNSLSYLTDLAENHGYLIFLLDYLDSISTHLRQHNLTIRPIKDALPVVAGIMHHKDAAFSEPMNDFLHCVKQYLPKNMR